MRGIALTGPTGVGKTAHSLSVARRFGCEIVSCDSMQIYRGMDIGTAKATAAERAEVPHHLIDILEPTEPFSTAEYRTRALAVAADITARGRLPLFVGGTGLYLSTLLRAPLGTPESDPAYCARRMEDYRLHGAGFLHARLAEVDPDSAAAIHENNVRRVIRALEIYDTTGKPKSVWDQESREAAPPIALCHITLSAHDRDRLYERTDARVDAMLREGLLGEVRELYASGRLQDGTTAAQAIGYKEMLSVLRGDGTLAEATEALKLATRHYIKRQLTWFSAQADAYTVYIDRADGTPCSPSEIAACIDAHLLACGFARKA